MVSEITYALCTMRLQFKKCKMIIKEVMAARIGKIF